MTQLHETSLQTADANGKAVCRVQAMKPFERWNVTGITVNNTSTVLVPTAKVYRGSESPSALIDGTFTGTFDHSDTSMIVLDGETILCVFTGADPGSQCTFTLTGEVKRR